LRGCFGAHVLIFIVSEEAAQGFFGGCVHHLGDAQRGRGDELKVEVGVGAPDGGDRVVDSGPGRERGSGWCGPRYEGHRERFAPPGMRGRVPSRW